MTKDGAKKGWHTRRVNNRYKEIRDILNNDDEVLSIIDQNKELFREVRESTEQVSEMRLKYQDLLDKVEKTGNVMDSLPIENLKDMADCEKYGKPSKGSYKDLLEASKIRRKAMDIVEEKSHLTTESRLVQLDMAEATCKCLLKLLDENEVSHNSCGSSVDD